MGFSFYKITTLLLFLKDSIFGNYYQSAVSDVKSSVVPLDFVIFIIIDSMLSLPKPLLE